MGRGARAAAAEDPAGTSLVSGSFSSSSSAGDGERIDSVAVKLCFSLRFHVCPAQLWSALALRILPSGGTK